MALVEIPEAAKKRKECKRCGMWFEDDDVDTAFRLTENGRVITRPRSICFMCEQDQRTEYAKKHTWERKAKATLRSHARKLGVSMTHLVEVLGWSIARIAHEMEHHFDNGCTECGHPYKGMEGGRGALTIDHWDRRLPPVYGTNTKLMCKTCNRAKGKMTPEQWIRRKRLWRLRDIFLREQEKKSVLVQPTLF